MTDPAHDLSLEARYAALEADHTRVVAENAQLKARIAQLEQRLAALEQRAGQDSQNSHRPPASDGLRRRPRPTRPKGQRPTGGQIGHAGHTLELVATPDAVVGHRPPTCGHCGSDLADAPATLGDRRQVFDLPPFRLQVTEHQQLHVTCAQCQHTTVGAFPADVPARTQYGPELRALAVYLRMQHLLPVERTAEVLEALIRHPIAQASILAWEQSAAEAVVPALEAVRDALRTAEVLHADETGCRIGPKLYWLHIQSTADLTLLGWHAKRGQAGIVALGVFPHFHGVAVHDRWASYWAFDCTHAVCHAHLQRDLQALIEAGPAPWASHLQALFLQMHHAIEAQRAAGGLTPEAVADWEDPFWQALEAGEAVEAARAGPGQTFVRALRTHAAAVLAFLHDPRVPFTNNQGERDGRMVKVQQKIAGCWRTEAGATAFCRLHSAIACLRKQGRDVLAVLGDLVRGRPISLLPAYT